MEENVVEFEAVLQSSSETTNRSKSPGRTITLGLMLQEWEEA